MPCIFETLCIALVYKTNFAGPHDDISFTVPRQYGSFVQQMGTQFFGTGWIL
jgi:hypothetical protein